MSILACFYSTLHTPSIFLFFFFNDTATTEIYTLSLHDALPIFRPVRPRQLGVQPRRQAAAVQPRALARAARGGRIQTRRRRRHGEGRPEAGAVAQGPDREGERSGEARRARVPELPPERRRRDQGRVQ